MIGRFATPMPASSSGTLSYNMVEFTSSGTWTKPSGLIGIELVIISAGAGGGSGSRTASGTVSRAGGSGGGGGVLVVYISADDLGATESITIGAGGNGGASVTADNTNGSVGTDGGNTSFGSLFTFWGGAASTTFSGGGQGSSLVQTPAGYVKQAYAFNGPVGRASSSLGSAGRTSALPDGVNLYVWQGPSDGGGVSSSNFASAGGIGTQLYNLAGSTNTSAAQGALGGGTGGNGVSNWGDAMTTAPIMLSVGVTGTVHLGTAAGGGGSSINSAGGGAGAPGNYGAGGAGGGASRNGYNSGAGGAGSSGAVKILEIKQL